MISVVILTYNEELHITRCLESALQLSDDIHIIDSYSTDNTVKLAKELGAKVIKQKWPGSHAEQLNSSLDKINFENDWVLRLDADEYLSNNLIDEIRHKVPKFNNDVNGVYLNRRVIFNGKVIKFGSLRATKLLRLWRADHAVCQNRLMDEHMIILEGSTRELNHDFYDHSLKDISFWIDKHNDYSTREAYQELSGYYKSKANGAGKYYYAKFPLFVRSFLFFIFKYILLLGFLDGKQGFQWNFFQVLWYRLLVDYKISELRKKFSSSSELMKYISSKYPIL